ncbi:putative Methionine-tRNA synthetase, partial [Fasciolopsis buskii]
VTASILKQLDVDIQKYLNNRTFSLSSNSENFVKMHSVTQDHSLVFVPIPIVQTYVWLDALINYLTVAGFPWPKEKPSARMWPPDFQFVGKDILRFHAVMWPALLIAVGLELPRRIICHNHLLVNGVKMSKSRQNVADPFDEQLALSPVSPEQLAVPSSDSEGLRYVLLRSSLMAGDFSYDRVWARQLINVELVNSIGNLLSSSLLSFRVTSLKLNPNQYVVRINRKEAGALFDQNKEDAELLEKLDTLSRRFDECWWIQGQPHLAIEQVLQVIRLTNGLIDRHKPWEKNSVIESEHVIALAAESLRLTGLLLSPVVPNLAARLLRRLGCEQKGEEPLDDHLPQNKLFWSLGPDTGPLLLRLP